MSACVCIWWFLNASRTFFFKEKAWKVTCNGIETSNESKALNKVTNGTSPLSMLLIRTKIASMLTQWKVKNTTLTAKI